MKIAPLGTMFREIKKNEFAIMIAMAAIVGLLAGYGAIVFRWLIHFFHVTFFGTGSANSLSILLDLPWYKKLIPPILGGILVGPLVYFLAREARGPGVSEVIESVALREGVIRKRVVLVKSLATAITIGSGGSAGREGPIVHIGSAIGSAFGQLMNVSADRMRTLVGCGAAAGIAATFNAPIAGVMFSLEIILGEFGIARFSPIVVSSVVATAVSRAYLGNYPAFLVPQYSLVSHWELPLYIVLGVVSGVVGVAFTLLLYRTEDFFASMKFPEYTKAAMGGCIVGAIGIFFPYIFGVGYDTIGLALTEKLSWHILIALVLLKIAATSLTIGSGGSGGIFGPSLFIGAVTGGAFGHIAHLLFPGITASSGAYSLVGMGALVSATTHGPISSIFILFEMTGSYKIILPLMLSCIIGTLVARHIKDASIYTLKLVRKGTVIRAGREVNILKSILVRDAMTKDVEVVSEQMHLNKLMDLTLSSKHASFPVVDEKGLLSGIISFQDFKEIMMEKELDDLIIVKDIATAGVVTIGQDESLDRALEKIGFKNIEQLPVVDDANPRKIIGILSRRDIFSAYNKAVINRSLVREVKKGETQN